MILWKRRSEVVDGMGERWREGGRWGDEVVGFELEYILNENGFLELEN